MEIADYVIDVNKPLSTLDLARHLSKEYSLKLGESRTEDRSENSIVMRGGWNQREFTVWNGPHHRSFLDYACLMFRIDLPESIETDTLRKHFKIYTTLAVRKEAFDAAVDAVMRTLSATN